MKISRGFAPVQLTSRVTTFQVQAVIVIVLMVGALIPRVSGLADYITTDEAYHWITRTERFSGALAQQKWSETIQTGHPGVTIMWLGSLGLALEHMAVARGWASIPGPIEHLAWLRLPSALLEGLLVPIAYLLLRRLVAPTTALIAAMLWATSPYLIAHARLLHLDALLTTFVTFSILLLLVAVRERRQGARSQKSRSVWSLFYVSVPMLIASGVCAGLALLTKGPALILLPVAGLLLLWQIPAASLIERFQRSVALYLLWLSVAVLVVVILWPGLWVDPGRAFGSYIDEITSNGGRPNGDGQFFLGHAVDDPGPFFYPVADLFRMTPMTLLGLLALPLALRRMSDDRRRTTRDIQSNLARCSMIIGRWSREPHTLLALGTFVLFWTFVMTLGPKKFDRYVLPTWPALLILASAGWTGIIERLRTENRKPETAKDALRGSPFLMAGAWLVVLAACLFEVCQPVLYYPYYLSYYNPIMGGGAIAQRALLIGWGEGMDQVGATLRTRPDIGDGVILSALTATVQPFVPVPVQDVSEYRQSAANYAVVYLESIQRVAHPEIYAAIRQTIPLRRINIHGIDYAEIYQLPKPYDRPIDAYFGSALHLRGATIKHEVNRLTVTPSWDVRGTISTNYQLFIHLIDARGRRIAQVDVAPGGGNAPPMSVWQPGQQIAVPIDVQLPSVMPHGTYQLVLGLYDARTGSRLPFRGGTAADPAIAGADSLLLDAIVW